MIGSASVRSAGAAVAAVVVAAAAIAFSSTLAPTPERIDTAPSTVPASHAQLSCPETATGRGLSTDLVAVAPPVESSGAAAATQGSLTVRALSTQTSAARKILARADQVATAISTTLSATALPAVTIDAVGGLAPAAYAAQRTVRAASRDAGLAVAACSATADSWWYAGVDTAVGSTSRLVLSNPTPAVAVVDLTFYGPQGRVAAVGAHGIPVAPRTRQSLDLARFAPGLDAVTVHVKATRGRVAAAVDVSRVNGVTPAGNEWLAASLPPANDVLVNAGDGGKGDQRLVITNPSGREAVLQVRVLAESGPFTPEPLKDLRIRPGRTIVEDVSAITGTSVAAFQVTTDQDQATVLAGLISESSQSAVDLSSTSSSPVLDGPAVVPVFAGTRLSLAFASGQAGGGAVRVQGYREDGEPVGEPTRIGVKAKTTRAWEVRVERGTSYLLATVAERSRLQGVATYRGRTGVSAIAVVSAPTAVVRPAVRPTD